MPGPSFPAMVGVAKCHGMSVLRRWSARTRMLGRIGDILGVRHERRLPRTADPRDIDRPHARPDDASPATDRLRIPGRRLSRRTGALSRTHRDRLLARIKTRIACRRSHRSGLAAGGVIHARRRAPFEISIAARVLTGCSFAVANTAPSCCGTRRRGPPGLTRSPIPPGRDLPARVAPCLGASRVAESCRRCYHHLRSFSDRRYRDTESGASTARGRPMSLLVSDQRCSRSRCNRVHGAGGALACSLR